MASSGVAPSSWLRSLVAWAVGAGCAAVLAWRAEPRRASVAVVVVAPAMLIATLFAPAVDGVHRWLDVGPLHINVAALVLPALIVALAATRVWSPIGVVVTVVTASVLLAQPDASQLTSFAAAVSVLLLRSGLMPLRMAFAILAALLFAVAGWLRPDPLEPVAEVEQIFTLSFAVSPFLAVVAGVALAAAVLTPLWSSASSGDRARGGAVALCAYFVAVSVCPFFGWFPVPLVGLGMSFPIGWWLGMGLLLAIGRRLDPVRSATGPSVASTAGI